MTQPKLGIICGGGELPTKVAQACISANRPFHVLALKGHAGDEVLQFPHSWITFGKVGRLLAVLNDEACADVVMIGNVRRPNFAQLAPDAAGIKLLPKIVAAARKGDDALLRALVGFFEGAGFHVVGVDDVIADIVGREGVQGAIRPSDDHWADIQRAIEVAREIGRLDIGQAAIVCGGVVLAVEAAEGTDAMLDRCADLPVEIRGTELARRGVLVKLAKPIQERRVDLPTIGPPTIIKAADAGLAGVAYEADGSLLINPKEIIANADSSGLFVIGIGGDEPKSGN